MISRRIRFTFEGGAVQEPLVYLLGKQFQIVTNIRMADVEKGFGWVILELDGEAEEIERGLDWMRSKGVRVDPIAGDVVEG